ncbi:cyclic nucleotide-binding domain-containing protein [Desulfococcaceae bacterium HSG8]|nr:cyclic nucleotide-binding domain-containing protein [Desulfococcaceae bacterium HSG8]
MDDFSRHEEVVNKYVKKKNKKAAVNLLFNLIIKYAREKNFATAETLKERLSEIDPMALFEIIKSDEIIEKERSGYLYQDHLEIWADLYNTLTTEEIYTLYSGMKKAAYDTNDNIFEQGGFNSKLYFIDEGYLKLAYSQEGKEVLLKTLGPGDIAGAESFFSITVCTSSLVALSQVKLSFLDKDILAKWQKKWPLLISKLNDYCLEAETSETKGVNRRYHKRVKMSGKVNFQILNASGNPLGKIFRGKFSDISVGGLSFVIRMSNEKNPHLLLGRRLNVKFTPPGDNSHEVEQKGTIIGVIDRLSNRYSIHIKFDEVLKDSVAEKIEGISTPDKVVTEQKTDIPSFIQKIKRMLTSDRE